jgi:ribosomal protein L37AE/L43A
MSKRCELQKEYYQQYGNYKGKGSYRDEYVRWLENEVLALHQPPVMRSFTACPSCGSDKIYYEGWWTCRECTHDWGGK